MQSCCRIDLSAVAVSPKTGLLPKKERITLIRTNACQKGAFPFFPVPLLKQLRQKFSNEKTTLFYIYICGERVIDFYIYICGEIYYAGTFFSIFVTFCLLATGKQGNVWYRLDKPNWKIYKIILTMSELYELHLQPILLIC